jgi:regulator of CtrA degradation
MGRHDGQTSNWSTNDAPGATTVSFIHKLAASDAFRTLFREGMNLVEEAATYLDGPGRQESRQLRRPVALAYATESMRLTTRLMQVASWLLLQRAINEGEMTVAQAWSEKHRVRITEQSVACEASMFEELPPRFRQFSLKSLRLQARVAYLDRSMAVANGFAEAPTCSGVATQVERLQAAFGR